MKPGCTVWINNLTANHWSENFFHHQTKHDWCQQEVKLDLIPGKQKQKVALANISGSLRKYFTSWSRSGVYESEDLGTIVKPDVNRRSNVRQTKHDSVLRAARRTLWEGEVEQQQRNMFVTDRWSWVGLQRGRKHPSFRTQSSGHIARCPTLFSSKQWCASERLCNVYILFRNQWRMRPSSNRPDTERGIDHYDHFNYVFSSVWLHHMR